MIPITFRVPVGNVKSNKYLDVWVLFMLMCLFSKLSNSLFKCLQFLKKVMFPFSESPVPCVAQHLGSVTPEQVLLYKICLIHNSGDSEFLFAVRLQNMLYNSSKHSL